MSYQVQFTPQALEDLSRLHVAIARRIADKIQWLAEHFDQIQPETLTVDYATLIHHFPVIRLTRIPLDETSARVRLLLFDFLRQSD